MPALLKLSCADTTKAELFFIRVLFILLSLLHFFLSHVGIACMVLRIRQAKGCRKAVGTCWWCHCQLHTLHMYLQPPSLMSRDQGKMVSLFYGIIIPLMNPIIYNLRNKYVKEPFKKLVIRTFLLKK